MRCPKCGSKNADTNRFCRHCGVKLEGYATPELQAPKSAGVHDEVAVGEDLFEVWQLYSRGDLDSALAKLESLSVGLPERAAVHSMFALIYERKAESEMAAGNAESARMLLLRAVERYEKVLALNPTSTIEREKLAVLRKKLGQEPASRLAARLEAILSTLRSAPSHVVAAAVVLVIAAGVAGFVWAPGPRKEAVQVSQSKKVTQAARSRTAKGAATGTGGPSLKIFTFPSQPAPSLPLLAPSPPTPAARQLETKPPSIEPLKVPQPAEDKVTSAKEKPSAQQPKPGTARADDNKPSPGTAVPAPEELEETDTPNGSSTLARAISLHKQGLNEQAVVAAQQSIILFQAEIDAGRNVEAAKRGMENARKLITLWQASRAGSEEE